MPNSNLIPYPLKCLPIYREKPWGGRKMEKIFGKPLPPGKPIGEAWEVADLPQGSSFIANGSLKGENLSYATALWGKLLIGESWKNDKQFPLLVKILDAREKLSVQVHPDENSCKKFFPQHLRKDESWIVLHADPEGGIYKGFKKGTTLQDFLDSLEKGKVENILNRLSVKKGDFIRIPPGTVHTLLNGVMLLEIQEPSDSTFRIFDYGRIVNGKPRTLHIEEAKKTLVFPRPKTSLPKPEKVTASWGIREILADTPAYRIERWTISKSVEFGETGESARVIFCARGEIFLQNELASFSLNPGETAIIPSGTTLVSLNAPKGAEIVSAGAQGTAPRFLS